MPKVLIADDISEECARILRHGGVEVDHRGKMKPEDLKLAVAPYEGLIVRSAVKVTKEIVEAGRSLKIIGRAGIGVDNIDQEAATTRRVLERVPGHRLTWKPHEKSMSLGQLALHVATTPGDVAGMLVTNSS